MSVRDDTPEGGAPGRPRAGRDDGVGPGREPEREPLGYYYDDGTNYETYDPEADEEGGEADDEAAHAP